MKKTVLIILGIVLILGGIPLLVLPGPGLLVIGAGAGILFSQLRKPKNQPRQPAGSP